MQVTITDDGIQIEGAKECAFPGLTPADNSTVTQITAITWAMARLAEEARMASVAHTAAKAIENAKGLH